MPRSPSRKSAPSKADILALGRKDPVMRSVAGEQAEALFAHPRRSARGNDAGDHRVVLGVYDYERDRSLLALIDTEEESVVEVREARAQFQLSDEERQEAERIAGEDPRVIRLLAGRDMDPLTRLYFPPVGTAAAGHRHAIVFLRPSRSERWYAIVDLSAGATVDIVSRRRLAGE